MFLFHFEILIFIGVMQGKNSGTHVDPWGFWFFGGFGVSGIRGFRAGTWSKSDSISQVPYTLAKKRLPSPFSDDTCNGTKTLQGIGRVFTGKRNIRPPRTPLPHPWGKKGFCLVSRTCLKRFLGEIFVGIVDWEGSSPWAS